MPHMVLYLLAVCGTAVTIDLAQLQFEAEVTCDNFNLSNRTLAPLLLLQELRVS